MKPITTLTILVLIAVAVAHVVRIVGDWRMTLAGWVVPMWASALVAVVSLLLAVLVWREQRRP